MILITTPFARWHHVQRIIKVSTSLICAEMRFVQCLPRFISHIGRYTTSSARLRHPHRPKAKMKVKLIAALEDNYMYLLLDESTLECAAIDPVEPLKVMEAVAAEGATLTSILTTHHHWDHAGGNEQLVQLASGLTVYGADDRVDALNRKVTHNEQFKVGGTTVRCLLTPCHTAGHVAYFVDGGDAAPPVVFTGDTLFVGGCGRFFEGTPTEMHTSLNKVLAKLPSETEVYCGHEYTVSNLKFAAHVEPDSIAVKTKLQWSEGQRARGVPTIPSTIGAELAHNPFMRVTESSVQRHTGLSDPVEVMGSLRREKDNFKAK